MGKQKSQDPLLSLTYIVLKGCEQPGDANISNYIKLPRNNCQGILVFGWEGALRALASRGQRARNECAPAGADNEGPEFV